MYFCQFHPVWKILNKFIICRKYENRLMYICLCSTPSYIGLTFSITKNVFYYKKTFYIAKKCFYCIKTLFSLQKNVSITKTLFVTRLSISITNKQKQFFYQKIFLHLLQKKIVSFTFLRGDLAQVDHVPLVGQEDGGDVLHSW